MDKALVDYFYRVAKAAMGQKIKNITELGLRGGFCQTKLTYLIKL